ncbi:MAG: hypothetical protein HOJ48_18110 [Desulfobacula sp.]|nr:hypothetical protein [Desulfobacula sp.]MBT7259809.1 hypothetical protein [Desulfobacula sp.]
MRTLEGAGRPAFFILPVFTSSGFAMMYFQDSSLPPFPAQIAKSLELEQFEWIIL